MASQPSTEPKSRAERVPGYLDWSRDPAVGLFVVMPLWVAYEVLRVVYVPHQRNGAEVLMTEAFDHLPEYVIHFMRVLVLLGVLLAARSLHIRQIPWLRVGLVVVLEGVVYGLMLGPVVLQVTHHLLSMRPPDGSGLVADLIGSLGAGIYEELLFRFCLLSLLGLIFFRTSEAFGLPKWIGGVMAILVSSLLFSLFHYGVPGALQPPAFLFRMIAGVLLCVLFLVRGIGVCVYTHAVYDVFVYLDEP